MRELSPNSIEVLESRYLARDEKGNIIETPEQMFRRVAKALASCEENAGEWEEKFFEAKQTEITPPGRPKFLKGYGTEQFDIGECGRIYVGVNVDENDRPVEIFGQSSSSHAGCPPLIAMTNKLLSYMLRMGVPPAYLISKLDVAPCHACASGDANAKSCPDAFRKILAKASGEQAPGKLGRPKPASIPTECPACHKGMLIRRVGVKCKVCTFCGEEICGT